jgi:hypothetical protein
MPYYYTLRSVSFINFGFRVSNSLLFAITVFTHVICDLAVCKIYAAITVLCALADLLYCRIYFDNYTQTGR